MKILLACEESQAVTKEMRRLGHDAFSCDLLPCSGGYPEWHLRCDVRDVLIQFWDMVIAFPPCDHLARSGARWWKEKKADGRQQQGIDFFMMFTELPEVPRVAIENPVGIMSTKYRKPDQLIHPFQFGHQESKQTCLWLKGLPQLRPTKIVPPVSYQCQCGCVYDGKRGAFNCPDCMDTVGVSMRTSPRYRNQTQSGQNNLSPGADRKRIRSRTYPGIAKAMADQWAGLAVL